MDARDPFEFEAGRAVDREAVRSAEQTVADAWIGTLLLAQSETEAVLGACARARERAADRVRAAQLAGNLASLARSQTDLELADAGWGRALEEYKQACTSLEHELSAWSGSTAHRVRQALSDGASAGRQ